MVARGFEHEVGIKVINWCETQLYKEADFPQPARKFNKSTKPKEKGKAVQTYDGDEDEMEEGDEMICMSCRVLLEIFWDRDMEALPKKLRQLLAFDKSIVGQSSGESKGHLENLARGDGQGESIENQTANQKQNNSTETGQSIKDLQPDTHKASVLGPQPETLLLGLEGQMPTVLKEVLEEQEFTSGVDVDGWGEEKEGVEADRDEEGEAGHHGEVD